MEFLHQFVDLAAWSNLILDLGILGTLYGATSAKINAKLGQLFARPSLKPIFWLAERLSNRNLSAADIELGVRFLIAIADGKITDDEQAILARFR